MSKTKQKHGFTGSRIYRLYCGIKQRCFNPNSPKYNNYGGRGITMCERWASSFENFNSDIGILYQPGLTLDRKDNNGNYEPGNCRWATRKEQSLNRKTNVFLTHNNITKTVSQWSEMIGITSACIFYRIKQNWPVERILSNESFRNKKNIIVIEYNGVTLTLSEWSKKLNIPLTTLYPRYYKKLSLDKLFCNHGR